MHCVALLPLCSIIAIVYCIIFDAYFSKVNTSISTAP